jgi:hypothetical protein
MKISCNMHSLSLQWKSSESEPLQVKDRTTLDPEWTKQGRIKLKKTEALLPIIDTLLTCARQNIALRGHREDEDIRGCSEPTVNDRNFRALLRYRMRGGDIALFNHVTGQLQMLRTCLRRSRTNYSSLLPTLFDKKYRNEFVRQAAGH